MNNINNENKDEFISENSLIFKKYKPLKKIGGGSFCNVYLAINITTQELFAMKIEKITKQQTLEDSLQMEAYHLLSFKNFGIPELISYGHTKKYNILIQTLLGKSLLDLYIEYKKKFDIKDICLMGIQIIERIEFLHSKNYIYRDIKPDNFLIGDKDPNIIYLIDFGLCKKYRSDKTGNHIMPKYTGELNGTLKFASLNSIKGKELSRKDDLISIGYMLIYFIKGSLPWKDAKLDMNEKDYNEMINIRKNISIKNLCNDLPEIFEKYLKYCDDLSFFQEPDYEYLKQLFRGLLNELTYNKSDKYMFSWVNNIIKEKHIVNSIDINEDNKEIYLNNKNDHNKNKEKNGNLIKTINKENSNEINHMNENSDKKRIPSSILKNSYELDFNKNQKDYNSQKKCDYLEKNITYINKIQNNLKHMQPVNLRNKINSSLFEKK